MLWEYQLIMGKILNHLLYVGHLLLNLLEIEVILLHILVHVLSVVDMGVSSRDLEVDIALSFIVD